ncbi:ankyrin repeat domain-containing protein [Candidatus Synechococcus spongiarum]|uniref:ankyrin repeat domain-containing protein n=1 Tax=Candidatus Synechococcus spongiarum TaxID=431041 RepID=UPI00356B6D35
MEQMLMLKMTPITPPCTWHPCRPWGYGQATRRSGGRCSGQKPCRQSPRYRWRPYAGLPEVIKLLVAAGSPVNLQDHVGDTPLHDAALQGQVEAARFSLKLART